MHLPSKLALAAVIAVSAQGRVAAAPQDIFGTWLRDDGAAKVRVAHCGPSICATNTWIRNPAKQGENVGDYLVFKIKPNGEAWSGSGYDPQRRLGFSAMLDAAGDRMVSRGCMLGGILCKSTHWTRL